ncbi:MAG TPA: dihydroorotase [Dehalococcoidia bacterium]|nr:dihydroorotase [Dehalococcoidia bacterium]
MRLLIRGGRVIDPANGVDEMRDVLIEDGRIASSGRELKVDGAQSIDATGLVVAPGFVDLHCHLREPGQEHKETIRSGAEAAARGGFTTICAMPNTTPIIDNSGLIESVLERAREAPVRVLPIGAVTRGSMGQELADLAEMSATGAVAFSDDGKPLADAGLMRRALEYSLALGRPIIDHCEDPSLSRGGVMNEGWVSVRLGLAGAPAQAEESAVARNIQLAELTGASLHLAHVSTRGSVDLVRQAKEKGLRVTGEATPHHLTLSEELVLGEPHELGEKAHAFNTLAKVNPPLRSQSDVTACVEGLADGVIDSIATDHAPHATEDKLCEFDVAAFGISGFETAFGLVNSLVEAGGVSLPELIERLTAAPARALNLDRAVPGIGVLNDGCPADLVILDPSERWLVEPETFASRGKNTPIAGRQLTGRVKATIADGRLVWSELKEAAAVA